jgi:hypothetical protein
MSDAIGKTTIPAAVVAWCEDARKLACMTIQWFGGDVPKEREAEHVKEMLRLTETCFEMPDEVLTDD